jgi:DNA-3-methyladenine glycosylase I
VVEDASDGLVMGPDGRARCWWCGADPQYIAYHDDEWGRPVHDDTRLFEKLCLEGFQAGLAWITILRKRDAFREVFHGFDPVRVAAMNEPDVSRLLTDARIVRHRGKIDAVIANAGCLLDFQQAHGSFSDHVWSFAPNAHRRPARPEDVPASTTASMALSRDLRSRGWRYVGPTTAYAFMQSMGLVDDHLQGCQVAPASTR